MRAECSGCSTQIETTAKGTKRTTRGQWMQSCAAAGASSFVPGKAADCASCCGTLAASTICGGRPAAFKLQGDHRDHRGAAVKGALARRHHTAHQQLGRPGPRMVLRPRRSQVHQQADIVDAHLPQLLGPAPVKGHLHEVALLLLQGLQGWRSSSRWLALAGPRAQG